MVVFKQASINSVFGPMDGSLNTWTSPLTWGFPCGYLACTCVSIIRHDNKWVWFPLMEPLSRHEAPRWLCHLRSPLRSRSPSLLFVSQGCVFAIGFACWWSSDSHSSMHVVCIIVACFQEMNSDQVNLCLLATVHEVTRSWKRSRGRCWAFWFQTKCSAWCQVC